MCFDRNKVYLCWWVAVVRDLPRYNLQSGRAYIPKEDFDQFRDYVSPTWAGKFPDEWRHKAMRSRIDPINLNPAVGTLWIVPSG